jgi:O-antigen/teichoic acid export membrane protein
VAAVLGPLVHIFRSSVNHVFLPTMSRLQSAGDHPGMIRLNARANAMVALLVFPLLAFAFVFAEQVITLVYTSKYLEAVPVMRLYVVGLLAFVVELVSILFVLGQGGFAARINATVLLIAVPVSFLGATQWGLTGAALGSIAAVYTERVLSLLRISRLTDTPVSRLQDWGKLAALLAAAAVAAAIAGGILHFTDWPAFFTLAAGGALLALAYPATLVAFGQKSELADLISSLRNRAARS